jgi:hypothetical protein
MSFCASIDETHRICFICLRHRTLYVVSVNGGAFNYSFLRQWRQFDCLRHFRLRVEKSVLLAAAECQDRTDDLRIMRPTL